MVEKTVYLEAESPEVARLLGGAGYIDTALGREEILRTSESSDNYQNWQIRRSPDNGKTWAGPFDITK